MAENLLSDARLRSASAARDGKYLPDGGALRFQLEPPSRNYPKGAKLARYDFKLKQPDGTYKNAAMFLGTWGAAFVDSTGKTRPFTLKDARDARDAARDLVRRGIDPRAAARLADAEAAEQQRRRLAELDGRRTVRQSFERWHAKYLATSHADGGDYVRAMWERHVLPELGGRLVVELRREQIADLLTTIAIKTDRTARALYAQVKQFAGWCVVHDGLASDPTYGLTRKHLFGKKDGPRQRALDTGEIIELRDKIPAANLPERVGHALWFVLATGCRIGELSGAPVSEFVIEEQGDTPRGVWHIAADRTKSKRAHDIPLSAFALVHLKAMLALRAKSHWLLPSGRDDELPISDKVITKMVRDRMRLVPIKGRSKASAALRLANGEWTPHDLRRTLATRMRDVCDVSSDVIEMCIGHAPPTELIATYQVSRLWQMRVDAFETWGVKLAELMTTAEGAANVHVLGRKVARRKVAT